MEGKREMSCQRSTAAMTTLGREGQAGGEESVAKCGHGALVTGKPTVSRGFF